MKVLLLAGILSLMMSAPTFAKSTGHEGGGGFYGKYKGQWVLLDELEAGNDITPTKEKFFVKVEKILKQVEATLPDFAQEMRDSLTSKNWHVVPFELNCEAPGGHLNVELSAGACQDDNDVWISQAKFDTTDKANLILHELIQSVRLSNNWSADSAVKTSGVRAIYRLLTRSPFPDSKELQYQLMKYNFRQYETFETYAARKKAQELHQIKIENLHKVFENTKITGEECLSTTQEHSILLNAEFDNSAVRTVEDIKKISMANSQVFVATLKASSKIRDDILNFKRNEMPGYIILEAEMILDSCEKSMTKSSKKYTEVLFKHYGPFVK